MVVCVVIVEVSVLQEIILGEVLPQPALPTPLTRVNYTDLDLSNMSLSPSPNRTRPSQVAEPTTDYAVIDFEATSAAAQAGRDHVRQRDHLSSLSRAGSVNAGSTQQP